MRIQYVATDSSSNDGFDASVSQGQTALKPKYLLHRFSRIFPLGYPQVTFTSKWGQTGFNTRALPQDSNRRFPCLRASRAWLWLAFSFSQLRAHAAQRARLKSSSLSTQRQLLSSQPTPANTSKLLVGRAFAPVQHPFHAHQTGGVSC